MRQSLWDEIRSINLNISRPWCAIGDFNAILRLTEKEGGRLDENESLVRDFQSCLLDCGMDDMGFKGNPFTWHRGELKERLDRAVSNIQWWIRFEEASIFHLPQFKSDHVPLWLRFKQQVSKNTG